MLHDFVLEVEVAYRLGSDENEIKERGSRKQKWNLLEAVIIHIEVIWLWIEEKDKNWFYQFITTLIFSLKWFLTDVLKR